ncbi:MAG: RlmE family RNA methyltransferase [Thermoplasmata archaeon]|nr:RlmE family RNA methyltransferase [Thermoplasmata archaeon]
MGGRFLRERRRDPYYRAAQQQGLRSRAAFKLVYLDQRFHLLKPGRRVLDLGAAPGGWSIVAAQAVGPRGRVVAVDPRRVEPIPGVDVIRARVGEPGLVARLGPAPFDVVLSDLSPRISGAYATDHARSADLVREAWALSRQVLVPGGKFAAKMFDGDLVPEVLEEIGRSCEKVQRTKPPASREASSEIYIIATGFRPDRTVAGGSEPAVRDFAI